MSESPYVLCPRCGGQLSDVASAVGVNTGKGLMVRGPVAQCDRCQVAYTRGVSGPVAGEAVFEP